MFRRVLFMTLLLASVATAQAAEGLVKVKSAHSVAATADRLEAVLAEKGLTLFKRVDHAAGAAGVGLELRPTEVIIFGNPKVGTPLMQCAQTVAIDLPQKALVWEDAAGTVWIGYNDPAYLQARHAIPGCEEVLAKIERALAGIISAAAE